MNDQRPTRWPCSADSSRNAGPAPRSFRNADTGVSVSSTTVWVIGISLCPPALRARMRTSSSDGVTVPRDVSSPAPLNEHLHRVGEAEAAAGQQHVEVVEDVGRLVGDALVGFLADGAHDLLGLLLDLLAAEGGVREQLVGVGARAAALRDGALERRDRLVGRELQLAVVKAAALAGVAGGA